MIKKSRYQETAASDNLHMIIDVTCECNEKENLKARGTRVNEKARERAPLRRVVTNDYRSARKQRVFTAILYTYKNPQKTGSNCNQ